MMEFGLEITEKFASTIISQFYVNEHLLHKLDVLAYLPIYYVSFFEKYNCIIIRLDASITYTGRLILKGYTI